MENFWENSKAKRKKKVSVTITQKNVKVKIQKNGKTHRERTHLVTFHKKNIYLA